MIKTQVAGYIRMVAHKLDGRSRVVADWFPNLITNVGLNRLGTGSGASQAWVGSGNAAPQVTDTDLQTVISRNGSTLGGTDNNGVDLVGGYGWFRRSFRFAQGVAAGNISEIGIGWGTTSGQLFSRALVRDGLGNPTTVTILSDETLDITYEFRLYWPTTDVTGTVTISGISYDIVMRAMSTGSWGDTARNMLTQPTASSVSISSGGVLAYSDGALGDITTLPGGSVQGSNAGYTDDPYVNNSYERVFRSSWGLTNITTSTSIRNFTFVMPQGRFKMSVNPMLVKNNERIMSMAIKVAWARRVI